jgi:hypothetical protein
MKDRNLSNSIDPKSLEEAKAICRRNTNAQMREYYEERIEDLQDTLMDLIALYAEITSELRTELELLRSEKLKHTALEAKKE